METMEIRVLRCFVAVAEELLFGRAAERLQMAQPPLSHAIQQPERRLGVMLLRRDRRGVAMTAAGEVLLEEARVALETVAGAVRRTRRAAEPETRLLLVTKAGALYELVRRRLDACAAASGSVPVELLMCEVGEQGRMLRDGSADVAIMHVPLDGTAGLATKELVTEGQVAILPAGHPLARRSSLSMAAVAEVPDLPVARWPRHDFSYPPGPGPEVHSQSAAS